ncbi:hypothetical protein [Actinocrispum sp. NPDC049592]|uniref:alginate O-acetyltransferase AlgX-related protein n=1 Tax=Actinocrispum sp. NPDC049592 TaxID=3154835 RepID=UPI0034453D26
METTQQTRRSLPPVHEAWLPREHSLHRPRHGRTQRVSLVCAVVFFGVPLLLLILGVRPEAIENRKLTDFPSPADGWGFFTSFDPWATDYLPGRAEAIDLEDAISRAIFGEAPKLGEQKDTSGPVQDVPPTAENPADTQKTEAGYTKVIEGKDGWFYLGDDISGPCMPTKSLSDVIGALQHLRQVVEASGRRFLLIVPPNKSTMVPEHLPDSYVGKDCAAAGGKEFWSRVPRETGALDVRSGLVLTAGRQAIYTKVDTHWTPDGALVMATELAERLVPGITRTWKATPGRDVTRNGDLPPLIGKTGRLTVRAINLAPDGGAIASSQNSTATFREALHLTRGRGTGVVDTKVGMLADSFTQPVLPFLSAAFTNVTVLHVDSAQQDPAKAGQMLADQDVVVLEAVERSLTGGVNPILSPGVIDRIGQELAAHPRK